MNSQLSTHLFLKPDVSLTEGDSGITYLKSNHQLGKLPSSLLTYLESWAKKTA